MLFALLMSVLPIKIAAIDLNGNKCLLKLTKNSAKQEKGRSSFIEGEKCGSSRLMGRRMKFIFETLNIHTKDALNNQKKKGMALFQEF